MIEDPVRLIRIARLVCTDKQLHTYIAHLNGHPQRTIALQLGISRRAVRDRIYEAERKIMLELNRQEDAA